MHGARVDLHDWHDQVSAVPSGEWERHIPIWCECCQLKLNGPDQWVDHVGGMPHSRRLRKPKKPTPPKPWEFKGNAQELHCAIVQATQILKDIEDNPDPDWVHPGPGDDHPTFVEGPHDPEWEHHIRTMIDAWTLDQQPVAEVASQASEGPEDLEWEQHIKTMIDAWTLDQPVAESYQ